MIAKTHCDRIKKMFGVKVFAVRGVDHIIKPFSEEVLTQVENNLTIRRLQKQRRLRNAQLQKEMSDR